MNFLLDTHIWLWTHRDPARLPSLVVESFGEADSRLWLSPVSIWELAMLVERKRVTLKEETSQWVEKSRRELDLREACFSWQVANALRSTVLPHGDPADRFLVATATVYDLTLVTADERLMSVPSIRVLPNR